MSVEQVYMDIPAVRKMAKTLNDVSTVLSGVCKALEGISALLKSTALFGGPGNAVALRFIDMIKPQIERVAKKCEELSRDVTASVNAFERGDKVGAARFH